MKNSFRNIMALSAAVLVITGCSGGKEKKTKAGGDTVPAAMAESDTMKIEIDPAMVDSIHLTFGDMYTAIAPVRYVKGDADIAGIARILSNAVYDHAWNDTGIMVKMVAPDNTLLLYRIPQAGGPEIIMIWKDGGRLKFNGKWFTLTPFHIAELYTVIT